MTQNFRNEVKAIRHQKMAYAFIDFVLTMVAIALYFRFTLMIVDPKFSEIPQQGTLDLYVSMRAGVDTFYSITDIFLLPMKEIFNVIGNTTHWFPNDYFPAMKSSLYGDWFQARMAVLPSYMTEPFPDYVLNSPASTWMPGYFDWLSLMAATGYLSLRSLVTQVYGVIRNGFLNIMTEREYVQKRRDNFNEELGKKNAQLQRILNNSQNLQSEISQLNTSVVTDELTQAYNRRFFSEKMRELFNTHKKSQQLMTVMMVDIDHFKKVNDTYGHLVGDEVLVQVSSVLKRSIPAGSFCCRYGGEEFAILMPNVSLERSLSNAELVRNEVLRLNFPNAPDLKSSISIGLATVDFNSPQAQANLHHYEDLIKEADDALYEAKTTGRNKVVPKRL
ncbi:MAG: GGDEF domain-containing protein [Vampirovibrio sp.]